MTMTAIQDLQDAMLDAQAEVQEVVREVAMEIVAANITPKAAMMWAQMSAEERDQFKMERPQEYEAFMKGLSNAEPKR